MNKNEIDECIDGTTKIGGLRKPVGKNRGISLRFKESRHVAKKEKGKKDKGGRKDENNKTKP
jgi:hypothetical protein